MLPMSCSCLQAPRALMARGQELMPWRALGYPVLLHNFPQSREKYIETSSWVAPDTSVSAAGGQVA